MPIWSVMCCQLWEDPSFFRLETNWVLMLMMRSAMPFTSCNLNHYHCFLKSGEVRMVAAIRAPLRGGLEYMGRIRIFSCDSTRLASSVSLQITVKNTPYTGSSSLPYRPMFLAYDWQTQTLMPCSMK
ncbi:unknown_gene_5196 [Phodopus roborovskii]|uniref:Unknown_gene_5196 protein n=1 Tax=Phodopus roborovskii TaxID=109678 RepID=A0AAV0A199_PHORO|nr:unknown_gene_5196 [Phodopus roborovskii]